MSLYANLLKKANPAAAAAASAATISSEPVKYSFKKSEEETKEEKKTADAALRFQPVIRRQAQPQQKAKARPVPSSSSPDKQLPPSERKPPSAPVGVTAAVSSSGVGEAIENWIDEDADDYYVAEYTRHKQEEKERQREAKKKRNKKKNQQHEAREVDWDAIYDPEQPMRLEDYKGSLEELDAKYEWKQRLHAHERRKNKPQSTRRLPTPQQDSNSRFPSFAPPSSYDFAPPKQDDNLPLLPPSRSNAHALGLAHGNEEEDDDYEPPPADLIQNVALPSQPRHVSATPMTSTPQHVAPPSQHPHVSATPMTTIPQPVPPQHAPQYLMPQFAPPPHIPGLPFPPQPMPPNGMAFPPGHWQFPPGAIPPPLPGMQFPTQIPGMTIPPPPPPSQFLPPQQIQSSTSTIPTSIYTQPAPPSFTQASAPTFTQPPPAPTFIQPSAPAFIQPSAPAFVQPSAPTINESSMSTPQAAPKPPAHQPSGATISRAPVRYTQPSSAPVEAAEQPSGGLGFSTATEPVLEAASPAAEEDEEDEPRSNRPGQKGFAKRLLQKYGWKEGQGLGAQGDGITTILQHQTQKRKKKSDNEGGGWAAPAIGKIVGGKKRKVDGADDEDNGAWSIVARFDGMLNGLDIDDAIMNGDLMQQMGEKMAEYGHVERLYIHRATVGREPVFVKFTSALSAYRAVQAGEGKDFLGNGRVVRAGFWPEDKFAEDVYE